MSKTPTKPRTRSNQAADSGKPTTPNGGMRTEVDSLGPVEIPESALWGAQTQRALQNFPVSGWCLPPPFIRAVVLIKQCAAQVNAELGLLQPNQADAIVKAADAVLAGQYANQFPVDVFQTGSGTSTNMNVNEVLAHLASRFSQSSIHANDHVNLGQSSNDVIPTAIHVSAAQQIHHRLIPALHHLRATIDQRAREFTEVVKTGRTHLMDAMPIRLDQELEAWSAQIRKSEERIQDSLKRLCFIAQGGTAVGTGVNSHPQFAVKIAARLSALTGLTFHPNHSFFESLSSQDTAVEVSGQLRALAVALMKISNDLRWMNSGPIAGLGEIALPALQPGSSIMPGKVNPVIPESVAMVAAQVMGYDQTIAIAGASGNFQLNVMLPLIAYNLLQSIHLLSQSTRLLADYAISGFSLQRDRVQAHLRRNPILVTALNPIIGYEKAASIAKTAYKDGRDVIDVAEEMTDLSRAELEKLLDPMQLTHGGIQAKN